MIIEKDFAFTRKYFVKDLLTPDSLIKGASVVEFASFQEFAKTYLRDRLFSLDDINMIIVPAEDAEEVGLLLSIKPDARPFLVIYLKDFSKETRDAFCSKDRTALLCHSEDIPVLKKAMQDEPSASFCDFMKNTYGYFRNSVFSFDTDKIPYIYSDPFFIMPFFCIADIRWQYYSFEHMTLKKLHGVVYNTKFVYKNMLRQQRTMDFKAFGGEGKRGYAFDYMRIHNPKRILVKDGCLYVDGDEDTEFNMYDERYKNAESVLQPEIDRIRNSYDVKLSDSSGVKDMALISIKQNRKVTGNPAMIPYICSIVSRTLNGGNV